VPEQRQQYFLVALVIRRSRLDQREFGSLGPMATAVAAGENR